MVQWVGREPTKNSLPLQCLLKLCSIFPFYFYPPFGVCELEFRVWRKKNFSNSIEFDSPTNEIKVNPAFVCAERALRRFLHIEGRLDDDKREF